MEFLHYLVLVGMIPDVKKMLVLKKKTSSNHIKLKTCSYNLMPNIFPVRGTSTTTTQWAMHIHKETKTELIYLHGHQRMHTYMRMMHVFSVILCWTIIRMARKNTPGCQTFSKQIIRFFSFPTFRNQGIVIKFSHIFISSQERIDP